MKQPTDTQLGNIKACQKMYMDATEGLFSYLQATFGLNRDQAIWVAGGILFKITEHMENPEVRAEFSAIAEFIKSNY
ncbi:hypothetical protein NIES4101_46150 [Calothrix sp. NIES-4101]|nr:hypothetical protein NIES4101_46150 [Calothrix sp. NIES-4101]